MGIKRMPLRLLGGTIYTSPHTLAACSHEGMTVPASYLWSSCMTMMPCTPLLTTSSEDVTANRSPYRMPVPKASRHMRIHMRRSSASSGHGWRAHLSPGARPADSLSAAGWPASRMTVGLALTLGRSHRSQTLDSTSPSRATSVRALRRRIYALRAVLPLRFRMIVLPMPRTCLGSRS